MSGIGIKQRPRWTKELDSKLLCEISMGKNGVQLEISMQMSYQTILKRLKEMGFNGLIDARDVMSNVKTLA